MIVTAGGAFAADRSIDTTSGTLRDLIQTDAALNTGHSKGAIAAAVGQVVDVDTAVAAGQGSTQASNIGSAIPFDTARDVVAQLRDGGVTPRRSAPSQLAVGETVPRQLVTSRRPQSKQPTRPWPRTQGRRR